jgi:hypothetical protein
VLPDSLVEGDDVLTGLVLGGPVLVLPRVILVPAGYAGKGAVEDLA